MITLNNLTFEPAEATRRAPLSRRSSRPRPRKPSRQRSRSERRQIEYTYPGDKEPNELCTTCHSMGRVIWQRRTRRNGRCARDAPRIYPGTDTVFRDPSSQRRQPGDAGRPAPDNRHPMDKAIDHSRGAFR
jgi:hypothetical protein